MGKTTLFSLVYGDWKNQIIKGQIHPGSRLLSMRSLCRKYQVSMRIVIEDLDSFIDLQREALGGSGAREEA